MGSQALEFLEVALAVSRRVCSTVGRDEELAQVPERCRVGLCATADDGKGAIGPLDVAPPEAQVQDVDQPGHVGPPDRARP